MTTVLIKGRDADFFAGRLAPTFSGVRFEAARDRTEALAKCTEAEILIIRTDEIFPELVDAMPKLRLIQALTTGTDHIQALPNLPKHVLLAAAKGFHGAQMSELVFIFMLHFTRDLRGLFATQDSKRWNRVEQRLLEGRTVVIVGVGAIAEVLAMRCKAFGMRVVGVSNGRTEAPEFDEILPRTRLREAAAIADFLIVLAPHNRETHHMIDAAVLAAMRPSGVLINIAAARRHDRRRRRRRVRDRAAAEGEPALGDAERVRHLPHRRHERQLRRPGNAALGGELAGVR
jgi:phosphoglycerate dehydrogenase-like enzyme